MRNAKSTTMQQKGGVGDLIKKLRVQNKIKQHNRRDKRYQNIYKKHEDIKAETVEKIESGMIKTEDQLKSINKKLQRLRNRMAKIEKRDTRSAAKAQDLINGLSKTYERLQNLYFNLLGTASEYLYSFRAVTVRLNSIRRLAVRNAVSTYKDVRSTWMPTFLDHAPTPKSSTTSGRIWSSISSFGSLVLKTILTGFMCLSFVMALIVVGASKLAVTIKERFFTK